MEVNRKGNLANTYECSREQQLRFYMKKDKCECVTCPESLVLKLLLDMVSHASQCCPNTWLALSLHFVRSQVWITPLPSPIHI